MFARRPPIDDAVQLITILGLTVCLGVLFLRAKAAKTRSPSSTKQRLKTAHVFLIALAVWLVVNFNLRHLNEALGGQPAASRLPGNGLSGSWPDKSDRSLPAARGDPAVKLPAGFTIDRQCASDWCGAGESEVPVSAGGVVSSADYASAPAVGLLVSIFGSGLADAPVSAGLPLPPSLGSTSVVLSGSSTPLPLLYAAGEIINVQIPYSAAVNSTQQLVVQRGNAILGSGANCGVHGIAVDSIH